MFEALITAVACLVGFCAALRRAKTKPDGKTAKAIQIMGGGGGPGVPDDN